MSNSDSHICRDYAEAMFRRAVEPLPPSDFTPDWSDRPSLYKIYRGVERLALPLRRPKELISMAGLMSWITSPDASAFPVGNTGIDTLATLLFFAHGVLSRRLRVHPSEDGYGLARYAAGSLYARGTASGGGLYPTEIYWACGSGTNGALTPGVYHYDNAHHALERLCVGDVTRCIQGAVFEHPAARKTDQFLLITLNFWKNAFKYTNFSYHVVTQDLGALLCSLWFLASALGIDWQPIFWYRDAVLNTLLGLDQDHESVFAVIPFPTRSAEHEVQADNQFGQAADSAQIKALPMLRSRRVRTFDMNIKAHRSTLLVDEARPDESVADRVSMDEGDYQGEPIALPPPELERLQGDLLITLQRRRSSFGATSATPPLSQTELGVLLFCSAAVRNYHSDIKPASSRFTRLLVFVNNVQGIRRGAYAYDAQKHCLWTIRQADMLLLLQQNYLLSNYSMADTGAIIAIVGDLEKMLAAYGNRGYRLLNAEAGLVAQGVYLVSVALSLACGAALGFNNTVLNAALGLDEHGQKTLLFLLIGREPCNVGDIDYRLV